MTVDPQGITSIVLLSGGLDSTVALASALSTGGKVCAVTFDYGQVNRAKELEAARRIVWEYNNDGHKVEHRIVGLGSVFIPSALTGSKEPIPTAPATDGPDATFVPGRNLVLIAVGAAIAQGSGATKVITGCNADDYNGYPDTRSEFMGPLHDAIHNGYGVSLLNPLLHASKSDILALARALNVPTHLTWSCYRGGNTPCGNCGSCILNDKASA